MIYITQLIYLKEGEAAAFDEFEAVAIPIISKYSGELLLRIRPERKSLLEGEIDLPYEIHLVSFQSENDFEKFMQDEERKKYLHLKEKSIEKILLIKGNQLG